MLTGNLGYKKKSLRAQEQKNEDIMEERDEWMDDQEFMDSLKLVFIDECSVNTGMTRLYGRAEKGERVVDHAPERYAIKVYDHDFKGKEFSQGVVIIPHGIYDIKRNEGYITLGTSKDTSEFACECIKDWWTKYGKEYYPEAYSILIEADGGGSNSSRYYIFAEDFKENMTIVFDKLWIIINFPSQSFLTFFSIFLFHHETTFCF